MQWRVLCVLALLFTFCTHYASCWVTVSKDGYIIEHSVIEEAGVSINSDLTIGGLVLSVSVSDLQCNPSRTGALRYNEAYFEACDGDAWRPLKFCSYTCNINLFTLPCGVPIDNQCQKSCNISGQGLNIRQCVFNAATTACGTPVVDQCNNVCGMRGSHLCEDYGEASNDGSVVIHALDPAATTASFQLQVGRPSDTQNASDNALYLDIAGALFQGGAGSVPFLKVQQMTSPTGLEIADTGNATLFRVRMNTELTGSMVQLGAPGVSHVYMEGYIEPAHTGLLPRDQGNHTSQGDAAAAAAVWDGFRVIDRTAIYAWGERDCPFLFNAGGPSSNGEKPAPLGVAQPSGVHLTRLCLEPVEAPRNATLPDTSPDPLTSPPRQLPFGTAYEADVPAQQANMPWSRRRSWSGQPWQPSLTGVVVTTGNLHDLASVAGLMHRHSLAYNGAAPPAFALRARVSCLAAAGAAAGSFCAVRDNATWSLGPTAALNLTEALAAGNVTAPAWWLPLVTDVGNAFRWCAAPQDDAPPPIPVKATAGLASLAIPLEQPGAATTSSVTLTSAALSARSFTML